MPRRIIVSSALNPEIVANRNMVRAYRSGARPVFAPQSCLSFDYGPRNRHCSLAAERPDLRRRCDPRYPGVYPSRVSAQGGSLFEQGYPAEWVSTLTAILAVTVWLGLFSYKALEYSHKLWWHFEYDAEFSRFLDKCFVSIIASTWQNATICATGGSLQLYLILALFVAIECRAVYAKPACGLSHVSSSLLKGAPD